jgi:hypothetical protein
VTEWGGGAVVYKYQAFLSYRRVPLWRRVVEIIHYHIEGRLRTDLGGEFDDVVVFHDVRNTDIGARYPQTLAETLAASITFVPILWPEYFASAKHWCREELGQMLARRESLRVKGIATPLIFPIKIHDFDPPDIGDIQALDLSKRVNPLMTLRSAQSRQLWKELEPLTTALESTIRNPPPYDPSWAALATGRFYSLFTAERKSQTELPTLGGGVR